MRWRSEDEVLSGKGETMCGAVGCFSTSQLCSVEVPFRYQEQGIKKEELVKVCVCINCAPKLLHKEKEEGTDERELGKKEKKEKRESKRKRRDKNDDIIQPDPAEKDSKQKTKKQSIDSSTK